jgi:hypothetical protein
MASLTQTSITARKTIRYIILGIIFLSVGKVLLGFGIQIYLKVFPPALPPATVKYGKLTRIPFPSDAPSAKLNFTLETATGTYPQVTPQAKVFIMPKVNPNLLSKDNAMVKVKALGFNAPEPEAISDTLYKFTDIAVPTNVQMNIVTGAFSISYDLVADRSPISVRPLAAELSATKFREFLSDAGLMPADLKEGPMIPEYYKLESGKLVKVLALSEADITKVNLFRKPYDELPSVTAKTNEGNIWGMVTGSGSKNQRVIEAEYHYFPVDEALFSTYPIISPEEAFGRLQAGQGYIATLGQYKDGDSLKIRNMYLAYYDPGVPNDFYQPVYVFDSGDNDPNNSFVSYLPAVTPEYIADN